MKTSRQRQQRIKILRYELQHYVNVTDDEMIDSLTFDVDGTPCGSGYTTGKILYIVLNYHKFVDRLNLETINEIFTELVDLENEQNKLHYYISLLESREAQVIRRAYFDGCSWDQIAEELGVVRRTAHKIKERAMANLAWMYAYIDGIKGISAPPAS